MRFSELCFVATTVLAAVCLSHSAQAATRPYLLDCDRGKGTVKTASLNGISIQMSPAADVCRVVVTNPSGKLLFTDTADSIQVSPALELGDTDQEFVLIQTDTDPYKLTIIRLTGEPAVVATITNRYGFWIQNDCADRRWHIWTADGAFSDDPEIKDIYHYDLIVPEVVFSLRGRKLVDVTPECKAHFDRRIARWAAKYGPRQISDFRMGRITDSFTAGQVKGAVLYRVLTQLYTGRPQLAKQTLRDEWPSGDVDRIWTWMNENRSQGMLAATR